MSLLQAKYLRLRLFMEGQEIPCISCSIQLSINSPALASIQIVPLDSAENFKHKTMVHLFYFDWTDDRNIDDLNDFTRYRQIFAGETVGYTYTKSPLGRSLIIQCADFSGNWSRAYQYMITYGPNGNFLTPEAVNYAAGSNKFDNIIDGHLGVLGRYLNSTPKSPGFRNIKGLLGGILTLIEQFGGVVGHQKGVLDYFTVSELKNKMMQQIAAEENDDTAQQIFAAKEFYEWLEYGLSQLGELCTLWDMIRLLFQYIFYESAPNGAPYYVKGTDPDKYEDTEKINTILEEVIASLYDNKDFPSIKVRATNSIKNLQLVSEYQNISVNQQKNLDKAIIELQTLINTPTYSSSITENLSAAKKYVSSAVKKLDKIEQKAIEVDRLNSIIMKPECYFVASPRCNVVFPEHTTQLTFSRNQEQEYTRLRLQSGMQFGLDEEKLFADFSYAPSGAEIKKITEEINKAAGKNGGKGQVRSAVLPWEKFSGVLPKFEYIQDINYVANKAQKDLQKNIQGLARSYKQKAANFNFYKYRFMARTMAGSCRFNPYLVVGFPLVVIDRPFIVDREQIIDIALKSGTTIDKVTTQDIIDNIKDLAVTLKAPRQYIGYPTTISHLIGQDGASTSFSCTHARPHRLTGDDFLTIYVNAAREGKGTVTTKTLLDADTLIRINDIRSLQYLIDLTPQTSLASQSLNTFLKTPGTTANNIPRVSVLDDPEDVTTPVVDRPKLNISGYDVVTPNFRQKETLKPAEYIGDTQDSDIINGSIKVPVKYGKLSPGKQGLTGTISAVRVINDLVKKINVEGKDFYVWSTLLVYEEKKNATILNSIPIEEVLRPTWFSSLYSNLKIGEGIYGKFFGCGSVVDEIVYQNSQGLSIQGGGPDRFSTLDKLTKSQDLLGDLDNLEQKNLTQIPSMESAIDILAFQYGEVIRGGLDVNRFIEDYTRRPIATLEEILGSRDLELKQVGNDLKISRGKLGFHSVAVSGYGDLIGLLSDPSLPLSNRTEKSVLPLNIDPRPERKAAVQEYLNDLQIVAGYEVLGVNGSG